MSYIILNLLACLRSQVPFFPGLLSPAVCKPISFVYISRAFRPLQSCGGFEMLLCADNSRTRLQVVKYGSCNTDELRCLGMGRVYIRPIQVDITLGDIEDDDEHAEECLLCRESIPLRGMRAHMETCRVCVSLVTFFLLFLGRIWSLLLILNFFFWNNFFVG